MPSSTNGGKSARPTADSAYHGSSNIRPKKGSNKKTGDDGDTCYPPTIDFATQTKSETASKIEAGIKARRPGGSMRGGTWHTQGSDHLEHTKADARSPNPTPNFGLSQLENKFKDRAHRVEDNVIGIGKTIKSLF